MNVVYVTGNENKARYFAEILGLDIKHEPADVEEIQSLNLAEVVTAKAKEAYKQIGCPVLVEDTSLTIDAMGRLPGTFVKWFLEEIGPEGICHLAGAGTDRSAYASAMFAYYDGAEVGIFEGGIKGRIAEAPRGDTSFGWNPTFIPEGSKQTLGEMDSETFKAAYIKIKPFDELRRFLRNI